MNIFKEILSFFCKKDKNNETDYIEFFGEKLHVGGNTIQNVPPPILYQRIFAILQKNSENPSLSDEFKDRFLEKKILTYSELKSLWILLIQTQWGLALASLIFEGFGKIPIYWCDDIHPYFIDKNGSYHQKWFIRLKYELVLFCIKEIQNNKEKKYKDLLSLLANINGYEKVLEFVSDTFLKVLAERVSDRTGLMTLVYDNEEKVLIIQNSLEELLITLRVIIKTFPSDMELADDWALIEKFFLSLKEGEK